MDLDLTPAPELLQAAREILGPDGDQPGPFMAAMANPVLAERIANRAGEIVQAEEPGATEPPTVA